MHKWISVVFWLIIAVLALTHAPAFAADSTAVGGQAVSETKLLTGASTATSAG
jgi:hypothetical protein